MLNRPRCLTLLAVVTYTVAFRAVAGGWSQEATASGGKRGQPLVAREGSGCWQLRAVAGGKRGQWLVASEGSGWWQVGQWLVARESMQWLEAAEGSGWWQ